VIPPDAIAPDVGDLDLSPNRPCMVPYQCYGTADGSTVRARVDKRLALERDRRAATRLALKLLGRAATEEAQEELAHTIWDSFDRPLADLYASTALPAGEGAFREAISKAMSLPSEQVDHALDAIRQAWHRGDWTPPLIPSAPCQAFEVHPLPC
jgi:hypothetical protein